MERVLGILMAITSLVFVVPMVLALQFVGPQFDAQGNPVGIPAAFVLIFPVMYLIMGYVGGAISSFLYNVIARYVGGFEFHLEDRENGFGRSGFMSAPKETYKRMELAVLLGSCLAKGRARQLPSIPAAHPRR